jgi:hypothetical protein
MDMNSRAAALAPLLLAALLAPAATAAPIAYVAHPDGSHALPPNASHGVATVELDVDANAHTMRVRATFAGLTGTVTAAHVHAPTATPGSGTANAATVVPTFTGFPSGVTSGSYDHTFDMTQATSYNPDFITDHNGDVAASEVALEQAIVTGCAYFVIHTSVYPSGELVAFFALDTTPTRRGTWAALKALYR